MDKSRIKTNQHQKNRTLIRADHKNDKADKPVRAEVRSVFFPGSAGLHIIILCLLGIAFYLNSLRDKFAFDDDLVINQNAYVQQGFAGIGKILSHGELDSFYEKYKFNEQFAGGRYRPLSIVTFAIERGLFGTNPLPGHLFNILYYVLTIAILYYFLRKYLIPDFPDIAFLTCLLFLIHPVHSEVIANIKSRNEIFPMLFSLLTFIFALKYVDSKKKIQVIAACFFMFLSLLSKEYGILLVILLPVLFYTLRKAGFAKSIEMTLPYLIPLGIYLFIRLSLTSSAHFEQSTAEPLNNQYILATASQAFISKIAVLLRYIFILVYPVRLACDYSYNQIPFTSLSDVFFWISLILHTGLLILMIRYLKEKHIAGFIIAFYLAHLFLISNLAVEIGTTFSERLIYMGSLPFCIFLAWIINWLFGKISLKPLKFILFYVFLATVTLASAMKVIERNRIWKDNESLFTHDAEINKGSSLLNANAGMAYSKMSAKPENSNRKEELRQKAKYYFKRAISIHPGNADANLNLARMYMSEKSYDSAFIYASASKRVRHHFAGMKEISDFYLKLGNYRGSLRDFVNAVKYLEYASVLDETNSDIFGNLGGAYYMTGNKDKARTAWEKALQLNPAQNDALNGMKYVKK